MKPLVVRSQDGRGQSPVKVDEDLKPPGRPRKSGEGAKSALEHLIQQERARVLDTGPADPPQRPSPT
jgi:hypothetical protein